MHTENISSVHINARARVNVRLSPQLRSLHLMDLGANIFLKNTLPFTCLELSFDLFTNRCKRIGFYISQHLKLCFRSIDVSCCDWMSHLSYQAWGPWFNSLPRLRGDGWREGRGGERRKENWGWKDERRLEGRKANVLCLLAIQWFEKLRVLMWISKRKLIFSSANSFYPCQGEFIVIYWQTF